MEGGRFRTTRLLLCGVAAALAGLVLAAPASAGLLDDRRSDAEFSLGGVPCELIEVPSAAPFGTGPCPGVRPGAIVESEAGVCTFNFLFSGSDGRSYMGTAGHCILGEGTTVGGGDAGEETWAAGTGPEALDGSGQRIGEFAYAVLEDPRDFALVRLDPGVAANPQMCHFGGPGPVTTSQSSDLVVLSHFGNGLLVGDVLGGRSALAFGMPDPDHVFAQGAAAPGDSGSGVITASGEAVGVLVTGGVHVGSIGTGGIDAGIVGITRLAPQLTGAGQALGIGLALQTAPLL